ncbi:hypothetical protein SAMN05661044_00897 [Olivibacter domesticus]|uniref:Uncharacterized protein n=1 Tax=Olivibacter domesticus TaxID=407022 RepID=A0A1H7J1W2_OLID1|nr:hypothetical protein SAMN05661044_00897 [Olivibacter domesticus]
MVSTARCLSCVKIIDLQRKEYIFTDRDNSQIIAPTVGFGSRINYGR